MTCHRHYRRIRASRAEEREDVIAQRTAALRLFLGRPGDGRAAALQRLLRAERRASHTGVGYDAARHAALRRLLAEAQAAPGAVIRAPNEEGRHNP